VDVGLDGEDVASAERGVAAGSRSRAGGSAGRAARLAHAGLAEQGHVLPVGERVLGAGDELGLALGQPQVLVVDLLGEG
jgi:hypothetical protein